MINSQRVKVQVVNFPFSLYNKKRIFVRLSNIEKRKLNE